MHRFFACLSGDAARLDAEDAVHALRVLRLQAGDAVQVCADGILYAGTITDISDGVTVGALSPLPSPEARVRVTLYQGLPKGDKMDYIAQKCVEAGVCRIVPVQMLRSVAKIDKKDAEKKTARWQKIAREAAKQSGRAMLPEIETPISFKQACARLEQHELALVPWEDAHGQTLHTAFSAQTDVAILIGPEGGIAPEEISLLPATPVSLGPRIFRTETAGLAALVSLLTINGDI